MGKKVTVRNMLLFIMLACVLTFVITASSYQALVNSRLEAYNTQQKRFSKLFMFDELIRSDYVHEIDEEKLMDGILSGYMEGLGDKYGMYLNKEEYASISQQTSGMFTGIGINVISEDKYIKVISVMKDSPAERNGVLAGDIITSVYGEDIAEIGYYVALSKFLGEEGTTVDFTVLRDGDILEYSIKREKFETYTVEFEMLDSDLGYIKITEFDLTTFAEFDTALNYLIEKGASKLIFDVRNNRGGELNAICNVLDLLLPEGPIIRTVDKSGNEVEVINSKDGEINMPMAVLINENTCSAAELFAAALKDYNKAELIGKKTYGKGTMQFEKSLGDGTAVSYSTRMYYPPFSDNYEGIGIMPDIEVNMPEGINFYEMTKENDTQLQKAIEFLK